MLYFIYYTSFGFDPKSSKGPILNNLAAPRTINPKNKRF